MLSKSTNGCPTSTAPPVSLSTFGSLAELDTEYANSHREYVPELEFNLEQLLKVAVIAMKADSCSKVRMQSTGVH
jgi:hypothetical protein